MDQKAEQTGFFEHKSASGDEALQLLPASL